MDQRIKLLVELSIFWGVISLIALFIAWKKDFFKVSFLEKSILSVKFKHVIIAFTIYLVTIVIIAPLLLKIINVSIQTHSALGYVSFLNIISFFLTAIFLGIYYLVNFKPDMPEAKNSLIKNFKAALIGWAVATPLVIFFSQISDLIVSISFYVEKIPDQLAVSYVKTSFKSPIYFVMAFFTIVFLAPIAEEILFRGFLQNWLKKHFGAILSIFMTAILFVSFHFSTAQKIGNIVILSALFPLAFFLSFLYEKQRTLICPIFMHAIFNLSSILSLLLIGES